MPRGDGATPEERRHLFGKPRPSIKRYPCDTPPPKNLVRRQAWWDTAKLHNYDSKRKYDDNGTFNRPGSNKK
jgi:hypothetical protein